MEKGTEKESNCARSLSASTESSSSQVADPTTVGNLRKKQLNWVVNMIVETIEEHVECEPVTIKIKKHKVRLASVCR